MVLVAVYFTSPRLTICPASLWAFTLAVGLLVLAAVASYQVKAIIRSRHPAVKAVEALAGIAPLFLLLFAAVYFLMAEADASN